MKLQRYFLVAAICVAGSLSTPAFADDWVFATSQFIPDLRAMIGKPLRDQAIDFNNSQPFVLEELTPQGARFFFGGNRKMPGETADALRQNHGMVVLLTPCSGNNDLAAKVSGVTVWEALGNNSADAESLRRRLVKAGLGLEQVLSQMNSPAGVVTPSTLRVPKVKSLHGPVFEYVRGDTTEAVSFVNEGDDLRLSWSTTNNGVCPH